MGGASLRLSLIHIYFDSHEKPETDRETIVLPVKKDDTDTVFAAKEAMRRGFDEFLLVGVSGGRLDHTLVNVYLLVMLRERGKRALLVDDYSEMELVGAEKVEIPYHPSSPAERWSPGQSPAFHGNRSPDVYKRQKQNRLKATLSACFLTYGVNTISRATPPGNP